MNAKSVKRALGLATAAVSTAGTMMLAPAVANAATAHPAHAQTVSTASHVSKAGNGSGLGYRHPHRYGYRGGYGGYRGGYGGYRGGYGGYRGGYGGSRGGYGGSRGGYGGSRGGYR
jgi:hypothetical protein